MHFDFIGKFETLREDTAYVIKRLGGGMEFPKSDPDNRDMHAADFVEMMKRNLITENYEKIKQLYAFDFYLF